MKKLLAGVAAIALFGVFANNNTAKAEVASGVLTQIHDGNLKFCFSIGDVWFYAPQKQHSFLIAGTSHTPVSFTYSVSDVVVCHMNNGDNGVQAYTVTNDVDLLLQ